MCIIIAIFSIFRRKQSHPLLSLLSRRQQSVFGGRVFLRRLREKRQMFAPVGGFINSMFYKALPVATFLENILAQKYEKCNRIGREFPYFPRVSIERIIVVYTLHLLLCYSIVCQFPLQRKRKAKSEIRRKMSTR